MDWFSFGSRVLWCVGFFPEISRAVRFCASCVHAVKQRRAKKGPLVLSINGNDWIMSEYLRTFLPYSRTGLKSSEWSELKQRQCCSNCDMMQMIGGPLPLPFVYFVFLHCLLEFLMKSKWLIWIIYYWVFTITSITKRTKIWLNQKCN